MPFALNSSPALSEISEAINYLLGNFGANLSADPNTGEIKGPTGNVIAYLYKYLAVKYADSADGAVNFSDSPTNRQYYGLRNSEQDIESTNPADYIWKQVDSGFGTTKFLWYQTGGGRQAEFFVGTAAPNSYFIAAPSDAIDLDVVTGNNGKMYAMPSIYIWTASSTPPPRPTTTSIYTWATGAISSVPAGWSSSIPATPSGFTYLWQLAVPLIESINVLTSVLDWTNVSYPITAIGAIGPSGATGPRTATGYIYYQLASLTTPATPTASGFNFVSGQFSSLSANWSTNFNAPNATDTTKFWAVYYSVSEATFGGTQTVTISTPFNWTNFNGLVTFTNLATSTGTTFIDGGNITTNTINVNRLVAGLLQGYTLRTGTGGSPNGNAFEVNSVGTVWASNLFGGFSQFENFSNNSAAVTGFTNNNRNFPAIAGYASSGNTAAGAHGVRGQSFETGAAGFVGGANNYDFYADGTGTNYGPFTGNHDILISVGETLTPGDLVVDVKRVAEKDWSNAVFEVAKSTQPNQAGCRGVFVGTLVPLSEVQPAVFIESRTLVDDQPVTVMTAQYEAIKDQYLFGSMSCLGEGLIQVTGEAGNIAVDTLLVTSSTAGVAMAQSDDIIRSKTVAKAREPVVFTFSNEVKIIACIYLGG
jgi:hypothetical protein